MRRSHIVAGLGISLAVIGAVLYPPARDRVSALFTPAEPIEITWLISHEPVSLFARAANTFAEEFAREGDGTIVIKLVGPKDFKSETGHLPSEIVLEALKDSKAQIATLPTSSLNGRFTSELAALNLPFLFENYASAERMLESKAAREILSAIDTHTDTHGLAFGYSGGLMVFESNRKQIDSAEDIVGLRIGATQGVIDEEILRAFGATPVALSPRDGAAATQASLNQHDAITIPYTRISTDQFVPRYITETFHSLFTTTIIVDKAFYASLTPTNQAALSKAAQRAAAVEREDSIALGLENRQKLIDQGTLISPLSPDSIATLKRKAESVYASYTKKFGTRLLTELQEAGQ